MIAYDATIAGIPAYQDWRKSLEVLPIGTMLRMCEDYKSKSKSHSFRLGTYFVILEVETNKQNVKAEYQYRFIKCTKTGKHHERVRSFYWKVEAIARMLAKGQIEIVTLA